MYRLLEDSNLDYERINRWIRGIPEAKDYNSSASTYIPTPPSSIEATSYPGCLRHRRKALELLEMDSSNEETPRKRRRGRPPGSSTSSSHTPSLGSVPSLPSTPLLRPPSPKRDLINQLRCAYPPIDWQGLPPVQEGLPEVVKDMVLYLYQGLGDGIIPASLKDTLLEADPWGTPYIRSSSYTETETLSAEDIRIWSLVQDTKAEAQRLHLHGGDENNWSFEVVHPLMSHAVSAHGERLFKVISIQTQAINPSYLPHINASIPVQKKADFTWAFSESHRHLTPYYGRLSLAGKGLALSQMSDTQTSKLALFCGVEVKRSGGDADEGLAQLEIWLAAGLRKFQELGKMARRQPAREHKTQSQREHNTQSQTDHNTRCRMEGMEMEVEQIMSLTLQQGTDGVPMGQTQIQSQPQEPSPGPYQTPESQQKASPSAEQPATPKPPPPTSLPLIGWTVRGHDWRFYLAWLRDPTTSSSTNVVSLSSLNTSTDSYLGIFTLMEILRRVEKWGREVYWPWVEEILRGLLPPD
ncbi:MAG: hypothetical protein Q9217_006874 [Psora testacea]